MTNDNEIPGMDDPEAYGIQDPASPGEPDYQAHEPSTPVPGTAKKTRAEHEGQRGGHHETTEGSGHSSGSGGRGGHGGH
jgi:hypothetical protein